ncbi:MAG TPA: hypothetical protein VMU26_00720 [Candidatus Polarisedimenticolia bacterium]|nr:hypothetical protein [Candidatus Polarisedimenticolia bacterium]
MNPELRALASTLAQGGLSTGAATALVNYLATLAPAQPQPVKDSQENEVQTD